MPVWLKALGIIGGLATLIGSVGYVTIADKWGSVFVILALIISLLKQVIAFIGFLTTAIKFLIIFAFAAIFIAVGLLAFRAFADRKKKND